MKADQGRTFQRRIYPLDPQLLTQEELAVVFAMTSRRPEPFDEIRDMVTAEKAADFHERWVLGYGHASVAEHAVIHMAVENISRLACDTLEDNRLGSYTEKSSRFQILQDGAYFIPPELDRIPQMKLNYIQTCSRLFELYQELIDHVLNYLIQVDPRKTSEREGAYNVRLRRLAIDSCRFVLPAAALTNVGVSMNARNIERAVQKLLSSELQEEREIGEIIKEQGKQITPTLIRYADRNEYLMLTRDSLRQRASSIADPSDSTTSYSRIFTRLLGYDPLAQQHLVTTLLYRHTNLTYQDLEEYVTTMSQEEQERVIHEALADMGPHDAPLRELELIDYTFEFLMDYGAYREFKRHRIQSSVSQSLTVDLGFILPPLIVEAGEKQRFQEAIDLSETLHAELASTEFGVRLAEYAVTHAHCRRVLSKMNLRECYHFFKLRTQPQAHFTIQEAAAQAMEKVKAVHPLLIQYVPLRQV